MASKLSDGFHETRVSFAYVLGIRTVIILVDARNIEKGKDSAGTQAPQDCHNL